LDSLTERVPGAVFEGANTHSGAQSLVHLVGSAVGGLVLARLEDARAAGFDDGWLPAFGRRDRDAGRGAVPPTTIVWPSCR
jgi:hypothetical protein